MSRGAVELDFFGMEKHTSGSGSGSDSGSAESPLFQRSLHRRSSFRGIQSALSKINPELLKSVIGSSAVARVHGMENASHLTAKKSFSVPSTPRLDQNALPALPVYSPLVRPNLTESKSDEETAPLTIFYNGTVTVFDVPRDKAENILKVAVERSFKGTESEKPKVADLSSDHEQQLLGIGDLPIARRKSLERFLEKRKERLTSALPYSCLG